MHLYTIPAYRKELNALLDRLQASSCLSGKTFVISGATGMIGSLITDAILFGNREYGYQNKVVALVRNTEKAKKRFMDFHESDGLRLIKADLSKESGFNIAAVDYADYIIHAASNTHPRQYTSDPINTVLANITGANSLLQLAEQLRARFLLLSSVEVYGENRGDVDLFEENYCGYIDCNTLRAGYPESKRSAEALCQAYMKESHVDFVTARLSRVYGPTLQTNDTKAMSQFLWNALKGVPIVLKSAGTQQYSYAYTSDVAAALFWLLDNGISGEAYNVSGKDSDVMLKDLAQIIADIAGTEVVFELPDAEESAGFSKATKAMLSTKKIQELGFYPLYNLKDGLDQTLQVLRDILE